MKTEIEVLELVYELNGETMDKSGTTGGLVFESSGFASRVTLYGEVVWDDQDYGAPYLDDDTQMPLRDWFFKRMKEISEEHGKMVALMLTETPKGSQP